MAGFVKMHSDSSWRGAENYSLHTFKILGFLRGRKCKRGAHASSEKGSQSSVAIHGQKKKKKDSGGDDSAPRVPLHSEQKKRLCVVPSAHEMGQGKPGYVSRY